MPTNRTRTGRFTQSRSRSDSNPGVGPFGRMARMNWLFKEEPSHYAFDALVRDKKTVWSGVRNPLAQKHLRSVKKGDRIFYYHTGDEKSVVGIAKALGNAYPDPQDKTGKASVVAVGQVT